MSGDGDEQRASSRVAWEQAAVGWRRRADRLRANTAAVSHRMVEAVAPQPGHRLLDLAAGGGETGFLAAELIAPGGRLICSDQSEAMLVGARERAAQLGLTDVEFKPMDAEWIDLPVASLDGVLCRWGLMLVVDPDAALRECRRVLASGGRLAVAVWDQRTANPWVSVLGDALAEIAGLPASARGIPGMFALADRDRLNLRLEEAGFTEVDVEALDFEQCFEDAEDYLDTLLDLSRSSAQAFEALDDDGVRRLETRVGRALGPYTASEGRIVLPARTLVVSASA